MKAKREIRDLFTGDLIVAEGQEITEDVKEAIGLYRAELILEAQAAVADMRIWLFISGPAAQVLYDGAVQSHTTIRAELSYLREATGEELNEDNL